MTWQQQKWKDQTQFNCFAAVVAGGDAGKYAVVVVDVLAVVAVAAVVMSVGHLVGKAESVAVSVGVVGIENLVSGGKRNAPI